MAGKGVLHCPLAIFRDEVAQYESPGAQSGASGVVRRHLQHLGEGLWY